MIFVGYDLGEEYSQISWCYENGELNTAFSSKDNEEYNFPTMLYKMEGSDKWLFGNKARKTALANPDEGSGKTLTNLIELARQGNNISIEGESYSPITLLALFIAKSLSLIGIDSPSEHIEAMTITVKSLDQELKHILEAVTSAMQLKDNVRFYYQAYDESFYHYMLGQPEQLWTHKAMAVDLNKKSLTITTLECYRRCTPMAAFVVEKEIDFPKKVDGALMDILKDSMGNSAISSVWLLGDEFSGEWYPNTLKMICQGRRAFRGNNLYSRGACLKAIKYREKEEYVFLGNSQLWANVGLKAIKRGKDIYLPLLNAGDDWHDAKAECEFYLEGDSFTLTVTPITGRDGKEVEIILNDLPIRGGLATRIALEVFMENSSKMRIVARDLGFGEISPSSNKKWQEELNIR